MSCEKVLVIKVSYGEVLKKIPLRNEDITLEELLIMFQRIFKGLIKSEDKVTIKYRDEEKDWITIDDNDDLSFALCSESPVRFLIEPKHEIQPLTPVSDSFLVENTAKQLKRLCQSISSFADKLNNLVTSRPHSESPKPQTTKISPNPANDPSEAFVSPQLSKPCQNLPPADAEQPRPPSQQQSPYSAVNPPPPGPLLGYDQNTQNHPPHSLQPQQYYHPQQVFPPLQISSIDAPTVPRSDPTSQLSREANDQLYFKSGGYQAPCSEIRGQPPQSWRPQEPRFLSRPSPPPPQYPPGSFQPRFPPQSYPQEPSTFTHLYRAPYNNEVRYGRYNTDGRPPLH